MKDRDHARGQVLWEAGRLVDLNRQYGQTVRRMTADILLFSYNRQQTDTDTVLHFTSDLLCSISTGSINILRFARLMQLP